MQLTHSHYAYVEGAVDMLDHNDTLGARQHRRVMWLGYYVVSQVLQATMRQSCRTRGMTRSIDPASTPRHRCLPGVPTCFSLITALCLWWRPNASLADHRNRIPYYTWGPRQGHESAILSTQPSRLAQADHCNNILETSLSNEPR